MLSADVCRKIESEILPNWLLWSKMPFLYWCATHYCYPDGKIKSKKIIFCRRKMRLKLTVPQIVPQDESLTEEKRSQLISNRVCSSSPLAQHSSFWSSMTWGSTLTHSKLSPELYLMDNTFNNLLSSYTFCQGWSKAIYVGTLAFAMFVYRRKVVD